MTRVHFLHPTQLDASAIHYVVAAARYQEQWLFVRHKLRSTWEFPGGHREEGEHPDQAMRRELWEETGAADSIVSPVCVYAVTKNGETSYGMLYYVQIKRLGPLPEEFEIAELCLRDGMPEALTYPDIVPALFCRVQDWRCASQD